MYYLNADLRIANLFRWSHDNNSHLKVSLGAAAIELINCLKFLGLQISDDLTGIADTAYSLKRSEE